MTAAHPAPRAGGFGHGIFRTWRGRLAVLLAGLAVIGAAAAAWTAETRPKSVTYRTQVVTRATVTQTVAVSGSLAAAGDQVRVFFASSGRIVEIPVHEGDVVAQGQALARLDDGDLQTALKQARVDLTSARAKYEQTIAGATPQDVAIAQNAIDTAQKSYEDAQRTTQKDVATAEQALARTRQDYTAAQTSLTLVTEGIETDITTFTTAIDATHAIVWTTLVDFKTKSTADITTAKTALGQVDAALGNGKTYATGQLAGALTEWTSARDSVIAAWLQFDGAMARGTDPSGATAQFATAQVAYTLAAGRLTVTLDPASSVMSSAQGNVTTAQNAMASATSMWDPELDLVRGDLAGLQAALVNEVELAATIKTKVSQVATDLSTIDSAIGGGYVGAQQAVTSARDAAAQSVTTQENALRAARLSLQKTAAAPQQADITVAYASVQLGQIALDKAQRDVDGATLRAPAAGTVTSIASDVGDLVSASATTPIVLLDPSGAMRLQGTVGEANVSKLQVGQNANVGIAAVVTGAPVTGTVSSIDRIATISNGVPVYGVAIDIAKPPTAARIGMTGTAQVVLTTKPDVLTIPNLAIRSKGGRRYVEVLKAGVPTEVTPVFGITNGTATEVASGLEEGDSVVLPEPTAAATQRPGGGVNVPGLRP